MLTGLVAAAEPSKVPFYIGGGILALWAVAISAVGLTRPSFPFGAVGERAVVLVSVVLAAVAIATAILTSR